MIDPRFDFHKETNGRDPDRYSPTLQEYHRLLWSKPLPNGKLFALEKISRNRLYHKSELGEFFLSSDRAVPTFWKHKNYQVASDIPRGKLIEYDRRLDTMGGIVIWPSNRIDMQQTINGAKGFNSLISDRLDLTIECIRLYYRDEGSPLFDVLNRYQEFFSLFDDFKGYIDFFLLQDFVSEDYEGVKIVPPFDNFASKPVPENIDQFNEYIDAVLKMVELRNLRITS